MGLLYIAEGTAPSTPSSGQGVLYIKSADSLLYYKSDGGTEYLLSLLVGGVVPPSKGGTGIVNNDASTITISGSYATTLTITGSTALTLPTSGTVTALGNTTTGSGSTIVLGTSPTFTTSVIGGATMAVFNSASTTVNAFGAATTLNIGNAGGTNTVLGATTFNQALSSLGDITTTTGLGTFGSLKIANGGSELWRAGASAGSRAWSFRNDVSAFGDFLLQTSSTNNDTINTTVITYNASGMNGVLGATTPAALSATTGTFTKVTAGDVITFTNGGASNKTGYLYSDNQYVGLFDLSSAQSGANGIYFDVTNSTVKTQIASSGAITTVSSTGFAVTGTGTFSGVLSANAKLSVSGTGTNYFVDVGTGANIGAYSAQSTRTNGFNVLIFSDAHVGTTNYGALGVTATLDNWALGYTPSGGTQLTPVLTWNTAGVAVTGTITATGGATFFTTSTALTDGAGAGAGTILNAPAAGNPTKWIGINDNGTTRYIPAW